MLQVRATGMDGWMDIDRKNMKQKRTVFLRTYFDDI
jgi:hypothetical protein